MYALCTKVQDAEKLDPLNLFLNMWAASLEKTHSLEKTTNTKLLTLSVVYCPFDNLYTKYFELIFRSG